MCNYCLITRKCIGHINYIRG